MRTVGMFKTKTHLPELIKEVEGGEELCITNRGKEYAYIIPVAKYYTQKFGNIFQRLETLKKRAPIGDYETIIDIINFGRK